MVPLSGLQIYLQPRVTLTFDLLTPKVDRYMLLPRGPLVPIGINICSFVAIAGRRYTSVSHTLVYRLPAIAAILFCWIRMKVVQQLTCLTQVVPMVRPIRPVSC